jgi:hypothetical protein
MDINKKKKEMINLLYETRGYISQCCKAVGIGRSTHYKWMNEDEEYKKSVEETQEACIDYVESKLLDQIEDNNPTSTIFYLKTKGKNRGYVERTELDVSNSDGTLQPTIDTKKLTTEQLKALKEARINADE